MRHSLIQRVMAAFCFCRHSCHSADHPTRQWYNSIGLRVSGHTNGGARMHTRSTVQAAMEASTLPCSTVPGVHFVAWHGARSSGARKRTTTEGGSSGLDARMSRWCAPIRFSWISIEAGGLVPGATLMLAMPAALHARLEESGGGVFTDNMRKVKINFP